jgi:monoamine oxidase
VFRLALGQIYEFQSTIFQPVGGMDMIAKGFVREIGSLIRYNAKVAAIKQDDKHVTVTYVDARTGGAPMTATADWCLCTIPLSVLDQIDLDVGAPMMNAINAVPYEAAAKIGLQFKHRFWEEDEQLQPSGLARGCRPVLAGRDFATAPARGGGLTISPENQARRCRFTRNAGSDRREGCECRPCRKP